MFETGCDVLSLNIINRTEDSGQALMKFILPMGIAEKDTIIVPTTLLTTWFRTDDADTDCGNGVMMKTDKSIGK